MPKKIFDIFPPEESKERLLSAGREKKVSPKPAFQPEKKKQISFEKSVLADSFFRKWWQVILLLLFLAGFLGYFQLPRAEIEIWPETEILNFQEKVTADITKTQSDFSARVIPAKILESEINLSEEFPASGTKEKRAEGIIRVYNAYSTSPQVLIAVTRFVSADGKLFRTPTQVTIPGGHYEKGKFVSGFIDVKVRADQPGEEYNIGPTTFSIPGFAGTKKYTAFYGKSFEAMSGGGKISQVKEEDLVKAKEVLVEKAFEKGKNSLKNEVSPDFILLDEAISQEVIEEKATAEAGAELSSFNFQLKIKSKGLSFKKSDLENLAKDFVISRMPAGKNFLSEKLEMNYRSESVDFKSGKIILNLSLNAKIYSAIDESSLRKGIARKTFTETQFLLENQPQITKFFIKLWPFWVKKVPENPEKIKIKINF